MLGWRGWINEGRWVGVGSGMWGGGCAGLSQFCTCYSMDMSMYGEGGGCLWIHVHIMDEWGFLFVFLHIVFFSMCVGGGGGGGGVWLLWSFSLFSVLLF